MKLKKRSSYNLQSLTAFQSRWSYPQAVRPWAVEVIGHECS